MRYWIFYLLMLALPTVSADSGAENLQVIHAWIRDVPPTAKMRAGYVELRNPGAADIEILAASSTDFEQVEMHETRIENGLAKMSRLEKVIIPARGQITFAPGGAHFMLIGPKRELLVGDGCFVRLQLKSGSHINIYFVVEKN